jgi:hypothetical protein
MIITILQFAIVVIKLGNTFFDIDKNVFNNILEMKEIILPFEWHSFCISIDLVQSNMKLYHNDHLQAVQNFTINHGDEKGLRRLMTKGHLGGQQFVGFLCDFQIFGTALSEDNIFEWTSCNDQVRYIYVHLLLISCIFSREMGICLLGLLIL